MLQLPLFSLRSDGLSNLIGALMLASCHPVPEVCIYFNNTLVCRSHITRHNHITHHSQFRGNRCKHTTASSFHAFESFNHPPLATVAYNIDVDWDNVKRPAKACHTTPHHTPPRGM